MFETVSMSLRFHDINSLHLQAIHLASVDVFTVKQTVAGPGVIDSHLAMVPTRYTGLWSYLVWIGLVNHGHGRW